MTPAEFVRRRLDGHPIESGRELVVALDGVRALIRERTPLWYLMNRLTRTAIAFAEDEERTPRQK
jgi:hypothetical protein